jgi:hypothetical protein
VTPVEAELHQIAESCARGGNPLVGASQEALRAITAVTVLIDKNRRSKRAYREVPARVAVALAMLRGMTLALPRREKVVLARCEKCGAGVGQRCRTKAKNPCPTHGGRKLA